MLTAVNLSEENMGINYINNITFKNITLPQFKTPYNMVSKFKTFLSSNLLTLPVTLLAVYPILPPNKSQDI